MKKLTILAQIVIVLLLAQCVNSPTKRSAEKIVDLKPTVLLISIDGFRWDYLEKYAPPNLIELKKSGVQAKSLIPIFPSATFPNHYSIVTGLYAEEHGITGNEIFDPKTNSKFEISIPASQENNDWWGGEPIWNTVEKQNQIAGLMFWVGSNVAIQKMHPHYWRPYDIKVTKSERIDQIIKWLTLPAATRPTFLTLYFEDVDTAGHSFGPESQEVKSAVLDVDRTIGELVKELKELGILNDINIILVSDHGMTEVAENNFISLEDYIPTDKLTLIGKGSMVGVFNAKQPKVIKKKLVHAHPHLHVYEKAELPKRFHYQKNDRIAPLILLADEGWYILPKKTSKKVKGAHGYDNRMQNMHGIFIAHGKSFKSGVVVDSIENINIYDLIAKLLSVTPAKNHGQLSVTAPMLLSPDSSK